MKKNIKTLILILFIISFKISTAQDFQIKGQVLDNSNQPIEYANVGILNTDIGTVSNSDGKFILNIKANSKSDTLRVSSFGFNKSDFLIKKSTQDLKIILEEHVEEISPIIFHSKKRSSYVKGKGKTKTKKELFFATSDIKNINLGVEIGRKFSLGKKTSRLKKFRFNLKKNNFEEIAFKINIYSIDKKEPSKRLNTVDIIRTIKNKSIGWIAVDLSDYDLITNQDIAISIQWIKASKTGDTLSLPIFAPTLSSTHYYKQSSQSKWNKYRLISTSMLLDYKQ